MSKFGGVLAVLLVPAFLVAGLIATPATAQEKMAAKKMEKAAGKVSSTVVAENEKVRVLENRFKPGALNETPPSSSTRVIHVLKGGTLLRTYTDGKTEKIEWKTGETKILGPSAQTYTTKNIGKSELALLIVVLK